MAIAVHIYNPFPTLHKRLCPVNALRASVAIIGMNMHIS